VVQPDGRYVWVGNDADGGQPGGVTVIDTETLKPVKQLLTGKGHHEIALSEDSRVAFVTNRESGTVSLIDVRKLAPLRDIAVSRMPLSVAYSPLARVAYVADGKEGIVTVLGGPDFAPVKRIALRPGLGPMRFTQDGRFAMVVNTYEDLVHVIDASSNELVHDIPVKGQPYQLAFTRAFAYVRALASERVTMINLLSLGAGKKPIVQSFVAGAVPPKAAGDLPLADSIAPVVIDAAVLIVNPADNTTYYYMEGMNAPRTNYQSYGAAARAVMVVDRGLKETAPGVYTSKVRVPAAGRYDVALFLNSPEIIECFSLEVKPNPALAGTKRGVIARFLTGSREVRLGTTVPVRVSLTGVDGKPRSGLTDVRMLSFLVPGQRREERFAREVKPGVYEAKLEIPEHGAYEVYVSSRTLDKQYRDLAFVTLRTARPELEARIQQRVKEAKR
jgi:YVTN family beta-propeller protein